MPVGLSCRSALWRTFETDIVRPTWIDLVEKRGLTRYRARTYFVLGALVMPWTKHPAAVRTWCAGRSTPFIGRELAFAGYCFHHSSRSACGRSASREVQAEPNPAWLFPARPNLSVVNGVLTAAWADTDAARLTATRRLITTDTTNVILSSIWPATAHLGFVECSMGPQLQARFSCRDTRLPLTLR